jgi:peptidoglycan/LPS O-acetylase OafA/YrhL
MDAAITAVFAVFDTIAFVILVLGLFMVATGKDVMPERLRARLRRVAATPRDQRLVGAGAILGGLAILLLSLGVATAPFPLWNFAAAACLIVAVIINLRVRRIDRRENRVSSGWDDITKASR